MQAEEETGGGGNKERAESRSTLDQKSRSPQQSTNRQTVNRQQQEKKYRQSNNFSYKCNQFQTMTTIRYFVPEDGDSEDHPNIFLMSKPVQSGFSPRLKDIKDSFPMPGKYHFRFKAPLIPGTDREKGAVSVWMDCVGDSQHVGVWRNTIFAKVTRINMDDDDEDDEFHAPAAAAPVSAHAQRRAQQGAAPPQRTTQQPPQQQQRPAQVRVPADNLLGVFDEHPSSASSSEGNLLDVPAAAQLQRGEGSLLDMNGPTYNSGSSANNSSHDDFMGMTSQPVQATHTPPVSAPVPAAAPAPASYGNPLAGGGARSGAPQNNAFSKSGPFGGLEWK